MDQERVIKKTITTIKPDGVSTMHEVFKESSTFGLDMTMQSKIRYTHMCVLSF